MLKGKIHKLKTIAITVISLVVVVVVLQNAQTHGRICILNVNTFVQSRSSGSIPIRVLMADSDTSLNSLYRVPLLREGFELVTAVSGLECIAHLRERVPDVLVLEPHIPWEGCDGILAVMRESPELAMLPVMILTSCHDSHVVKDVECFQICDYQLKPLTPDRLVELIRGLLDYPRLRFTLNDQNGRLECAIARRTDGRVRDLRVEVRDGHVIVHGCTQSYHVNQLALAAVLEAVEASESQSLRVESEIEVCGDCGSTVPSMCFNSKGKREFLQWNGSREEDL